jgi:hypothetical protein
MSAEKNTIGFVIRFFTDGIAENKGEVLPKHMWDCGIVRAEANSLHGIEGTSGIPFNGLHEIPEVITKLRKQHNLVIHVQRRIIGKGVDPERSDAAKRAWGTIRKNRAEAEAKKNVVPAREASAIIGASTEGSNPPVSDRPESLA